MDMGHSSASSSLPWIWVIEALAKEKEVDMSVLTDLAAKTPEIFDEVGKDARNILLLRCLERFNATGLTPNIEIDKLTDHEDIRHMFTSEKFPAINEGSDIQTLIQNIRRSLPKSALERIKDVICEGRHPIPEFLKKSSRLSTNDDLLDNLEAAVQLKGKEKVHSGQVTSMRRKLPLSAHSNQSQDPIKMYHVSSQCKRIDPTSHNKLPEHLNAGNSSKDESDSLLHVAKKAKDAAGKKNEATEDVSAMVSNELSENLLETDSCLHIAKKAKPAVSKKNETTKDVSAMVSNELSENLVEPTVISKVDKLDRLRSKEVSHDDGSGKNNFLKEKNIDHPIGPSVCSLVDRAKMKCVDVDDDGETEGDGDGIDDENIEIEKQRFLKSQGTFSEDTFSATQNTELNLCIKCNRDGQLLICKTRTCTIVVHPSCLGYDAPSPFYCPFCAYSNAFSEYLESKKQLSLSRKSLRAFIAVELKRYVEKGNKQSTHNKHQKETLESCLGDVEKGKKQSAHNKHQKEPLESCLGGNQRSRRSSGVIDEEYVGSECETEHNLRGEQITKKMVVINVEEDDDILEDTNKPRENCVSCKMEEIIFCYDWKLLLVSLHRVIFCGCKMEAIIL
ncbi:uncharacterized protein LOC124916413 [Impatiens glandulifera]|uniref:uncharacterized protein LOC124916413 n=1 Tax=Impatiens glandulifera TaxID=253017 RepID=UPI001FB1478B|nr:uncharacterized protein LOC124916413 [Impatiens glandulifera]